MPVFMPSNVVPNLDETTKKDIEQKSKERDAEWLSYTSWSSDTAEDQAWADHYRKYLDKNTTGILGGGFLDPDLSYCLSPYSFKFSTNCQTYKDVLKEIFNFSEAKKDNPDDNILKSNHISFNDVVNMLAGDVNNFDPSYIRPCMEDTSPGGNEAINCRWAFNRDDDIIHPVHALNGNPLHGGLGRVYFEKYQAHHQLLHITLGVSEFNTLFNFYRHAVDGGLANDVNSGESFNISRLIGQIVGGAVGLMFSIPMTILRIPEWIAERLDATEKITKYYELRSTMPMYYRYVNSIFAQLSVAMGFTPNAIITPNSIYPKSGTGGKTDGPQSSVTLNTLFQGSSLRYQTDGKGKVTEVSGDPNVFMGSFPKWMRKTGPDVYKILARRDRERVKLSNPSEGNIEEYMANSDPLNEGTPQTSGGLFDGFSNRLKASTYGADKFIAFRINKGNDASESVSNQTGQSSIANLINSAASAAKDARFSAGGSLTKIGNLIGSIPGIGSILKMGKDLLSGVVDSVGFTGMAKVVMTGSGFVDIPEVWTGSSFSKNYGFSLTFRPGAGDNASILQDCYLPLCMCLAMACPRSVGMNSFSSPFLMRAYCKGMFAVPLGIVESMQITRGGAEFGWNMARLPTVIGVNLTIKDLSPIMHLAMADTFTGLSVFCSNSSMMEYMNTLSGLGLQERILFSNTFARRMALASQMLRTTWLNPNFHATNLGQTAIGRIYGALASTSLFSNK